MDIQPITTLDTYKGLVNAGFSENQAEAVIRSVNTSNLNLATSEELSTEIMRVKSEIALFRKDVELQLSELRTELKADIASLVNDMNKRFNALIYTQLGLILAVAGLVVSIKWV